MMSDILDPTSRRHLSALPIQPDWQCIEIGSGNGSVSQWVAGQLQPPGKVRATDLSPDLLQGIETWDRTGTVPT